MIIRALRESDVGSKGRGMAHAASHLLLTAEALIVFRRVGICGGRSGSTFFFLRARWFSSHFVVPPMHHILPVPCGMESGAIRIRGSALTQSHLSQRI